MSRMSPRRVVHVQLAEPLGPLAVDCDGRGVYAVFWFGDLALGHEYFDVEELPLDPADLAAIAAAAVAPAVARRLSPMVARYPELAATAGPLQKLRARAEASPEPGPPTSVVVLADDDPDGLAHCLRSLQRSTVRPEGVVVVHFGKDHSSAAAVCSAFGHSLYQPGEDLDVQGEVVAVTDDRSVPHPNWVGAIAAPFRDARVGVVAGLVLPEQLKTEAQVAFVRLLGGLNLGFLPRAFDSSDPPPGLLGSLANLALSTGRFQELWAGDRMGREALGRLAAFDLRPRPSAVGAEGRYDPAAVVLRRHPPSQAQVVREASRGIVPGVSPSELARRAARDVSFGSALERRLVGAQVAAYFGSIRRSTDVGRGQTAKELTGPGGRRPTPEQQRQESSAPPTMPRPPHGGPGVQRDRQGGSRGPPAGRPSVE